MVDRTLEYVGARLCEKRVPLVFSGPQNPYLLNEKIRPDNLQSPAIFILIFQILLLPQAWRPPEVEKFFLLTLPLFGRGIPSRCHTLTICQWLSRCQLAPPQGCRYQRASWDGQVLKAPAAAPETLCLCLMPAGMWLVLFLLLQPSPVAPNQGTGEEPG